jgi:hypothetical protein
MKSALLVPALLAAATMTLGSAGGCADRTYLTKSHGRAYSEAFSRQAVEPEPRKKKGQDPTQGLDSQEAAAIAGNYRHSLAGKEGGAEASNQHQLLLNPNVAASQGGYMPPPSVPGGQ